MDSKYEKAVKILIENKQEHIISIMENLTENKKDALVEQILNINFNDLKNLYNETKKDKRIENIEPIYATNPDDLSKTEIDEYIKTGKDAIKRKKLAVCIMAGGQGTRLRI